MMPLIYKSGGGNGLKNNAPPPGLIYDQCRYNPWMGWIYEI
jgi:hypothetical protein